MGSRGRSRSSTLGSSEVVLEGGSWFGSTLASLASQGLNGAAEVGWRSFNGVTFVWIDVELTGAASSWLGDGGKGVAVWIGIRPFLASSLWGLISDGCGSGDGAEGERRERDHGEGVAGCAGGVQCRGRGEREQGEKKDF